MVTFAQYIQKLADPTQQTLLIDLVKASPVLGHAPLIGASGGEFHKYKHYTALPNVALREFNGGFVKGTASQKHRQLDLLEIGTTHVEDRRVVESLFPGNPSGYFDQEAPAYFEAMGQAIAKAIFYGTGSATGTFENLTDIATANSATVNAGGSGSGRTTIFCVKWDGIATGLAVNPAVLIDGAPLIRVTPFNNLMPISEPQADSTELPVYKVGYSTIFNLLNNTNFHISAMVNVKDDTNTRPTAKRVLEMIDKAKATPGNSFIYMNRAGRRMMAGVKDDKIQTETATENYVTTFGYFEGIPLVLDENITTTTA